MGATISTNDYIKLIKGRICDEKCEIIRELCDVLYNCLWRGHIVDAMRNFTDHKLEHSFRVFKRILQLTDNAQACNQKFVCLNEAEIYALALSALLHDIAMSGHPKMEEDKNIMDYFDKNKVNEIHYEDYPKVAPDYSDEQQNEIRSFHAYFAIAKIKLALSDERHSLHGVLNKIDSVLWDYIYIIIKFHSKEKLSDIPSSTPNDSITGIRICFSTVLFRMADELDLGIERDIKSAREQGMPSKSKAYWEMDYRINVDIDENNYINLKFRANKTDIDSHKDLFNALIENHIKKNKNLVNKLYKYNLMLAYNECDNFTIIDDSEEVIQSDVLKELRNIANSNKPKRERENDRISFLEETIMNGFKLKKNYMGIILPRLGDKYKLYVYKEFYLLKNKDSIKFRVHVNRNDNIKAALLNKEYLNLSAYVSYHSKDNNFGKFIKCDEIDELSAGEEYLQFKLHFTQNRREHAKLPINKGDTIAVFYTYEVNCVHYGKELVRDTTVFTDADLVCELVYPKENEEYYEFNFYERNEKRQLTLLDERYRFKNTDSQSMLYKIQKNDDFKKIIDKLFTNTENNIGSENKYLTVDYKQWICNNKKNLDHIYHFVATWNFVPFFTDPDMYLKMERYANDGSPSGFTKINNTTLKYTPYSQTPSFDVNGIVIDNGKYKDYGTSPDWLSKSEILVHPDYIDQTSNINSSHKVIPTASSRTLYLTNEKCFAKLQYNNKIGRIERYFTPQKIEDAVMISSLLKEKFDNGTFPDDLFFLPESFGRIVDFGENPDNSFWGKRYLGMIIRDYMPYPNIKNTQWRLIPAFSLFSKENKVTSKSIIELIYDFRADADKILKFEDFLFEKIIKPTMRLYFELLLNTGLHIEGHAQNILYLLIIDGDKLKVKGAVIRDFESFDKDLDIIERLGLRTKFKNLDKKTNSSADIDKYTKRNSFLFDFKLGEYLITPLLDHSQKIVEDFDREKIVKEIKAFSDSYIKKLPRNFFPKNIWYSYKNIDIDRSTEDRPWEVHKNPKYRGRR